MLTNNLDVRIIERPELRSLEVWVVEQNERCLVYYNMDGDKITSSSVEYSDVQTKMKPFLVLPLSIAQPIFDAIGEYSNKVGRKTKNENHLEGKMDATKYHLEDMRKIVENLILKTQPNEK